jgi:subtilisin family serine protease
MKKTIKTFIATILAIIITIGSVTAAFASNESNKYVGDDGKVTLSISADKSKYSSGETIKFKIDVTNVCENNLSYVNINGTAKNLLKLVPNNNTVTIPYLAKGETKTIEYDVYIMKYNIFFTLFILPWKMIVNPLGRLAWKYGDFNNIQNVRVGISNQQIGFNISYGLNGDESSVGDPDNYFSRPNVDNIAYKEDTGAPFASNEILITAKEGTTVDTVDKFVKSISGKIVGKITAFDEYQIRLDKTYTSKEIDTLINKVKQESFVYEATYNYAMPLTDTDYLIPQDDWGGKQNWNSELPEGNNWGVEAIKAPVAWAHRDEMSPITIGLLDGGFDENHPDLTFSYTRDFGNSDHGCHVAGIMAANIDNGGINGVMPTNKSNGERLVNLIGVSSGTISTFTIEIKSSLAKLILRGTKVINYSMGYNWYQKVGWTNYLSEEDKKMALEFSAPVGDFLSRALNKGYDFIITAAACNDSNRLKGSNVNIDAEFGSPMTTIRDENVKKHIIVVGAIESLGISRHLFAADKLKGYELAYFSNIGNRVDVVAPGYNIYSCKSKDNVIATKYGDKKDDYGYMSGTSQAAPHVAGVAAMVWSINPNLTGSQVKQIVTSTSDRPITLNNITYNILNAENAVNESIKSKSAENPWRPDTPENGMITSKVVESSNNNVAISNVVISAYNEEGTYVGSAISSVYTDENGQFELILPEGKYTIIAYADGYMPAVLRDIHIVKGEVNCPGLLKLAAITDKTQSSVKGAITNALNNSPIAGASMRFLNLYTQEFEKEITTDSNGSYNATLPVGCYEVEVKKEGFVSDLFNVMVAPDTEGINQNYSLSPVLSDGEYRIVLTWGDRPNDLDSHITGTTSSGSTFHVYYSNKNVIDENKTVANLDVDDTSSYGPETVTLTPTTTGTYRYYIHNYSGNGGGTIAGSGAQIKLYKGNSLLATYNAPTDQGDGIFWTVFEITNGVIKSVNKIDNNVYIG